MTDSRLFVRLLVGFLLSVTGTCCPIEVSPPQVVMKYGDPVSINCSTSDSGHQGMGWEAGKGGIGLRRNVNHLTWSLKNLTDWTLEAECFINPSPEFGTQCTKKPKIVLYTFPGKVYISSSGGDNATMRVGEQYNLTCEVKDVAPAEYLSVEWYKDDKHFHTESFDNSTLGPTNKMSMFTYTPTKEDNGVSFRCEAIMDLRPGGPYLSNSSETIYINVQFGPEMDCSIVEIEENGTLASRCPILGNPTPFIKWIKNGKLIDPSVPLRRENAGNYTVEAEGFSFFKKEVQVRVLYGPELHCAESLTALEHTPSFLNCTVKGYPEPKITLYKDGDEVELLWDTHFTRNDAGQYNISASIGNNSVTQTFDIIVYYPPSPILELEDSEFTVGSSVSLKCSSSGYPRPQYSWTYYQTANVLEENDDGVSRLLIHNATIYNMGDYMCHAWNEHGNVSKTARLTAPGAKQECPLQISPDLLVLEYNSEKQNATCKALTNSANIEEIYWQDSKGIHNSPQWVADTLTWDPRPVCKARFKGIGPCEKTLNFILYKKPDSVSIRVEADNSTLTEGFTYTLVCEVTSVAPVESLMVRWYQGNESFTQLNGENVNRPRTNMSLTFSTNITANRTQDGAEFACEALLNLPGQNVSMKSSPLYISVHYGPSINTTKLSNTVPVFSGYAEDLICEADGNPPPSITWSSNLEKLPKQSDPSVLTVTDEGTYKCIATNYLNSASHEVKVISKVDYLPLIAGFVAVTVVIISVIFVFIYSIYYKNTKMRRYSLKNPKLSTHNGNVAHNGWDLQLPMTKLS